jgi:hypothetical protein
MISAALSRVQSALLALPFYKPGLTNIVEQWFDILVYPNSPLNYNLTPVQSGIAADGKQVTFIAQNERDVLASQFLALAKINDYPEVENKLLQRALAQIPDGKLEAFLHTGVSGIDQGWTISGLFDIAKAFELTESSETKTELQKWYKDIGSNACLRVGRSVGGAYTVLHSELAGDTAGENIEYYLNAAEVFGLDALPNEVLELIAADQPDFIEIFFHVSKAGIVKFGLRVPEPSLALIQAALFAFGTEKSMNIVGDYEGALGVQKADYIDLYITAKGYDATLFYVPAD